MDHETESHYHEKSSVIDAGLWGASRLLSRFGRKRVAACAFGCGGCDVAARARCLPSAGRADASGVASRLPVLVLLASVLALSSGPLLAQPAKEDPPAEAAASAKAAEPPEIRKEIEKLKADLEKLSGGVSISGFFDVQATNPRNDPSVVSMGDFEIDLAKELGKDVQVGAAVVVNDEGASLAVAFVDFHAFGGLIAPRGKLPVEKGFHVQLGRFDVPFGNDWQYFASKDRTEASAPLTTDVIMGGGYNATGLRILGNTGSFNYSALALGGNGSGTVFGGRLGFTPLNNPYQLKPLTHVFEAGVSLLHDLDGESATRETSFALDSEVAAGPCRLRAEYLRKDTRAAEGSGERVVQWGWHVTAAFDAGEVAGVPMTPYARYDNVTKDAGAGADAGRTERLTAGLNAVLFRLVTLKLEYQRILAAPLEVQAQDGFGRDTWLAQVVVAF